MHFLLRFNFIHCIIVSHMKMEMIVFQMHYNDTADETKTFSLSQFNVIKYKSPIDERKKNFNHRFVPLLIANQQKQRI